MQLYKAQIVQAMNDEYKEMMRQAVDEVTCCCHLMCHLIVFGLALSEWVGFNVPPDTV